MTRITQRLLFQTANRDSKGETLEPSSLIRAGKISYVNSD